MLLCRQSGRRWERAPRWPNQVTHTFCFGELTDGWNLYLYYWSAGSLNCLSWLLESLTRLPTRVYQLTFNQWHLKTRALLKRQCVFLLLTTIREDCSERISHLRCTEIGEGHWPFKAAVPIRVNTCRAWTWRKKNWKRKQANASSTSAVCIKDKDVKYYVMKPGSASRCIIHAHV